MAADGPYVLPVRVNCKSDIYEKDDDDDFHYYIDDDRNIDMGDYYIGDDDLIV